MANYVVLVNWTEQGVHDYQDAPKRAEAAASLARNLGGDVKDVYWTLGPYDLVVLADFPDDEAVTAFGLRVGAMGNVRTTTLRAFNQAEMTSIIDRSAAT